VRQEEPDAASHGVLDARGDGLGKLDAQAREREHDEDDALEEDGCHSNLPLDAPGAAEANDVICEVRVQSHARGKGEGKVSADPHEKAGNERCQRRNRHELAAKIFEANGILSVVEYAGKIVCSCCTALARPARVGEQTCVHSQNICPGAGA